MRIGAVALCLLAAGLLAASAMGSVPPGPRLATVELIETKGSEKDEPTAAPFMSLTTFGPSGERKRHLLKKRLDEGGGVVPFPFFGPEWSLNGSLIAFIGASGKGSPGIYVAEADGRNPRFVRGTRRAFNPVLAPDGTSLAFSRTKSHPRRLAKRGGPGDYYESTSTWIIALDGGSRARRLTSWQDGLGYVPESFSPDGSLLVLTKRDDDLDGHRIALMRMDGGETTELGEIGEDAAISPDGRQLAFVGYRDPTLVPGEEGDDAIIGELYTMNIDGTQVRRLTRNKNMIEYSPSWDPSGERLAFVAIKTEPGFIPGLGLLFPQGNAIVEINADGSCRTTVRSDPEVAHYGVAWQPGPERGAGRIECPSPARSGRR